MDRWEPGAAGEQLVDEWPGPSVDGGGREGGSMVGGGRVDFITCSPGELCCLFNHTSTVLA